MENYKIIEVKENLLADNEKRALELREKLKDKDVYLINVMASPGSGKTTLLINLINRLKKDYHIGVIEADLDGDVDAARIHEQTGVKTMQINTCGTCHLTAQMVDDAINNFDIDGLNIIFLENVGNLVCPAEFDTGSNMNLVLLSVPEGDDKPLKYPLMFEISNVVAITKIETAKVFKFDFEKSHQNILKRQPNAKVFELSAIKDEGVEELEQYLRKAIGQ